MCPHCGKRLPPGRSPCPNCSKGLRATPERKIPIVTAIIAIVFFSVVVFGAASVIIARFWDEAEGDVGLHLNGTWEIESPTFNDEFITYVFAGDSFSSVTETMIFNASADDLENIREFHRVHSGARVEAVSAGDGNYSIRITADGTFTLDGNSILLVMGDDLIRWLSFYWDGEAVIINGDRFLRQ